MYFPRLYKGLTMTNNHPSLVSNRQISIKRTEQPRFVHGYLGYFLDGDWHLLDNEGNYVVRTEPDDGRVFSVNTLPIGAKPEIHWPVHVAFGQEKLLNEKCPAIHGQVCNPFKEGEENTLCA